MGVAFDPVTRALEAFAARDLETMTGYMTDDVIWATPGSSPLAGEFCGPDDVKRYLRLALELTGDSVRVDLVDRLVGREYVAIVVDVSGDRLGLHLDQRAVQLFRLRDGRIAERRIFPPDLAAWDEFWSA